LPKYEVTEIGRSKVIYKYECPKCLSLYVGRTKRSLSIRIKEHMRADTGRHHLTCRNTVGLEHCFKVIDSAASIRDLVILEALHIRSLRPLINTQLCADGTSDVLSMNLF